MGHRKTPTVLQMEAVECGAAALAIVLGYHGRIVSLETLRVETGVSRDGSNAANIVKAARTYGFEARGRRLETSDLHDLPLPAILHWNFGHFVVLEGFGRGKVYLNDPAEGRRVVSEEELDTSFTGIVLTFERGPDFQPGGRKPSLVASLRSRLSGSESALAYALLAGLALVAPGLVIPTFSRIFVDDILVRGLTEWLHILLVGMAATAVLRALLSWLRQYYLLRLETKISITSSSRFLWHILRLPLEFYSQRYAGEVANRVAFNDRVAELVSRQLAARFIDAVMVIFFALLMLAYDPLLTAIGIVAVVLIAAATVVVNRRRVDANRQLLVEEGKAYGTLLGALGAIETLKASGTETDVFARWAGQEARFINVQQRLGGITQSFLAVPPLLIALATSSVLALGAYRVMQGELTMGMLVAFQSLMASFLAPVNNLVSLASNFQEMEGMMNRLDDVHCYEVDPQTVQQPTADTSIEELEGGLELRDVTFGYSKLDAPLIESFSLQLPPGSRVALVGASGSGKSTVANLIAGLYEPWSGQILFDGADRHDVPRGVLAGSFGKVDQDIHLFAGSIRDNLTMWDASVSETRLVRACRDAFIHDDIMDRDGGYGAEVAEGGVNFSAGQAQRLEIARVLAMEPVILVLDEATAALDAITEKHIDRNLRDRGCTCVIVAHRLSTIRDADEIIVMQEGKVTARGTHEMLMADPEGLYARLVENE